MEIKPIRMTINAGLVAKDDALVSLDSQFRSVSEAVQVVYRDRYAGAADRAMANDVDRLIVIVGDFLALMTRLDNEYGPVADADFDFL